MTDYLAPERDRTALITIDAQRDFALPSTRGRAAGSPAIISAMGRLAAAFRERRRPIFHMVRLYRCDGSNVDLCHRASIEEGQRIVMPGTTGAELVDELKPDPAVRIEPELLFEGEGQTLGPQEWVLYKPRLSAFFGTPLETRLHQLGVTTVVICGCDFQNSPRATIYAASNRDFRMVMVADAVSRTTDTGLQELGSIGVRLMNTEDCLAWLAADATARPQRTAEARA
jgi:nicotinamidase-related amidase